MPAKKGPSLFSKQFRKAMGKIMTVIVDRLLVSIGFEDSELKASRARGLFYVGILFTSGAACAFFTMAALS